MVVQRDNLFGTNQFARATRMPKRKGPCVRVRLGSGSGSVVSGQAQAQAQAQAQGPGSGLDNQAARTTRMPKRGLHPWAPGLLCLTLTL